MPRRIDSQPALAGRLFDRGEALAAGLTIRQVEHRVTTRRWLALRPGQYVEATWYQSLPVPQQLCLKLQAVQARRPDLVGSHRLAATVSGMSLLRGVQPGESLEVTLPAEWTSSWAARDGLLIRRAPSGPVITVGGAVLLDPARTVVDLARDLGRVEAVVAMDSALRLGLTAPRDVIDCLSPLLDPGELGRWVAAFADRRSENALESVSRVRMWEARLPRPQLQVWTAGRSGRAYRVDFAWPDHHVVGEADGKGKYRTPEDLAAEKARQEDLEDAGHTVVRWGYAQAVGDFTGVAGRLRRTLA
jgi:very-short-patch-repair endonuclease